jgi:mono/diheme cytochrome c family protein
MTGHAGVIGVAAVLLATSVAGRVLAEQPVAQPPPVANMQMPRSYQTACAPCHANGGFGVLVLAERPGPDRSILHQGTALPAAAIRAIVRNGLGHMPAMSRVDVSDAELDAIAAYLTRDQR